MEISEHKNGDVMIVELSGRLDAGSSGAAEEKFLHLIEAGERRIVVDLAKLDYISSVGLRVLMLAAKRLKPLGGRIALCALQKPVKQIFDIAGFGAIFPMCDTRDQAAGTVGQPS